MSLYFSKLAAHISFRTTPHFPQASPSFSSLAYYIHLSTNSAAQSALGRHSGHAVQIAPMMLGHMSAILHPSARCAAPNASGRHSACELVGRTLPRVAICRPYPPAPLLNNISPAARVPPARLLLLTQYASHFIHTNRFRSGSTRSARRAPGRCSEQEARGAFQADVRHAS